MKLDVESRNAALDTYWDAFDNGTLKIYTGSAPATPDDAPTGDLLGTIDLPADAFNDAASGQKTKKGTWECTASGTGLAGYARFSDGSTKAVDITVGEGSGDFSLDETSIVSGGTITVTAATMSQPAS